MNDTIAARIHGTLGLLEIAREACEDGDPAMALEVRKALAEARRTLEGALDELTPGWRPH